MVTDNRSAGHRQPVDYCGYDPLLIVDLKVHMLIDPTSGKRDGFLRVITEGALRVGATSWIPKRPGSLPPSFAST